MNSVGGLVLSGLVLIVSACQPPASAHGGGGLGQYVIANALACQPGGVEQSLGLIKQHQPEGYPQSVQWVLDNSYLCGEVRDIADQLQQAERAARAEGAR